jgi:hypothetical protein
MERGVNLTACKKFFLLPTASNAALFFGSLWRTILREEGEKCEVPSTDTSMPEWAARGLFGSRLDSRLA